MTMGNGTSLLLELFNGNSVILDGIFLLWGGRYLWLETRRRHLGLKDWLTGALPPSMALIIAVMVHDFSDWMRAFGIWIWRRFYNSGAFPHWFYIVLIVAGAIGVIGGLCKIRAVTKPDWGNEPWLICLVLIAAFVIGSVLF